MTELRENALFFFLLYSMLRLSLTPLQVSLFLPVVFVDKDKPEHNTNDFIWTSYINLFKVCELVRDHEHFHMDKI